MSLPLPDVRLPGRFFENDRAVHDPELHIRLGCETELLTDLFGNRHLTPFPYFHTLQYQSILTLSPIGSFSDSLVIGTPALAPIRTLRISCAARTDHEGGVDERRPISFLSVPACRPIDFANLRSNLPLGSAKNSPSFIMSRKRRGTPGAIGLSMTDHLAFLLRLRGYARLRLAVRLWNVRRRIRSVIEGSGLLEPQSEHRH
jgi:hypothetical protein